MKSYNIRFPLVDDPSTNTFFSMTKVTKDAFSSNLMLLLLTQKGERYYDPNYGTNLLKYIFEPNDNITSNDIEQDIKRTVSQYIPNLIINNITYNWNNDENGVPISDNQLNVNINFTFNEDTFTETGELNITIQT